MGFDETRILQGHKKNQINFRQLAYKNVHNNEIVVMILFHLHFELSV